MASTSGTASGSGRVVCPFCGSGRLVLFGHGLSRCDLCGMPLIGSTLETLREILGLPDALGAHPCECGHPEMRALPGGVFHCPACRAEVLPVEMRQTRSGRGPRRGEIYPQSPPKG